MQTTIPWTASLPGDTEAIDSDRLLLFGYPFLVKVFLWHVGLQTSMPCAIIRSFEILKDLGRTRMIPFLLIMTGPWQTASFLLSLSLSL